LVIGDQQPTLALHSEADRLPARFVAVDQEAGNYVLCLPGRETLPFSNCT
jgi:hypothetical protein